MSSNSLLMTNPIIRKVAKCEEIDAQNHVTYKDIAFKVILFLIDIAIGIALFFVFKNIGHTTSISNITIKDGVEVNLQEITNIGYYALAAALVFFCLSPILTTIFKFAIPVTGFLYFVSTGYIVTFVAYTIKAYQTPIFIAFFLTNALFLALALIYSTGKIKVTQKFKAAVFGIILASVLFSLVLVILNFIPALKFIPEFFWGNSIFGIIVSVIGLIIAVLFVIVDFSVIQDAVDRELPKKYEWFCAYALVFSLIYLYFKILDLIIKASSNSKSKN